MSGYWDRCLRCRRVCLTARDDASGLCVWCRIAERDRVKAEHMNRTLRRITEED